MGDVVRARAHRRVSSRHTSPIPCHFRRRNEPDSGWGWQLPPNNATNVAGYVSYFDATGAGVSDAEASTGLRFELWGPASGKGAGDKRFLPAVFEHYSTGTNMWTGAGTRDLGLREDLLRVLVPLLLLRPPPDTQAGPCGWMVSPSTPRVRARATSSWRASGARPR